MTHPNPQGSTALREALERVERGLDVWCKYSSAMTFPGGVDLRVSDLRTILAALTAPAADGGEPVAWRYRDAWGRWAYCEPLDNEAGPNVITEKQALYATHRASTPAPIPMVLHCPSCGLQHIDAPTEEWNNPPHRSHLCHGCGFIWRPADVPTTGVAAIQTRGKADSASTSALSALRAQMAGALESLGGEAEFESALARLLKPFPADRKPDGEVIGSITFEQAYLARRLMDQNAKLRKSHAMFSRYINSVVDKSTPARSEALAVLREVLAAISSPDFDSDALGTLPMPTAMATMRAAQWVRTHASALLGDVGE